MEIRNNIDDFFFEKIIFLSIKIPHQMFEFILMNGWLEQKIIFQMWNKNVYINMFISNEARVPQFLSSPPSENSQRKHPLSFPPADNSSHITATSFPPDGELENRRIQLLCKYFLISIVVWQGIYKLLFRLKGDTLCSKRLP